MSEFQLNGDWTLTEPSLEVFLKEKVLPVCDAYGLSYYGALDRSYDEYLWEGIAHQLLYIAGNLRSGNKNIEDELEEWSRQLEARHVHS